MSNLCMNPNDSPIGLHFTDGETEAQSYLVIGPES